MTLRFSSRVNEEPDGSETFAKAVPEQVSRTATVIKVRPDESCLVDFVRIEVVPEARLQVIVRQRKSFRTHEVVKGYQGFV